MACVSCREKHYRCDGKRPKCGRCDRVKRRCIREPRLKFLFDQSLPCFRKSQTWVSLPKRVDFFDETTYLATPFTPSNSIASPEGPTTQSHSANDLQSKFLETVLSSTPTRLGSPQGLGSASSQLKSSLAWPLSTLQEAHLLRHWVENVSRFFDFFDPMHSFAIEVPQRARSNRTLANAVFANSARHLSGVTDFDTLIADQYLQECLRTLIPALEDGEAVMDDNFLASLVILRMLEEMDVPFVGSDLQSHLFGTQAIIRAQRTDTESSSLSQAARWCAFRQEIFGALNSQRSFQLTMTQADIYWAMNAEEDSAWACRAALHCRDAIQFSFAEEARASRHVDLVEGNIRWRTHRPISFDPFYVNHDQKPFPDIRMHMDWHIVASQYNILAHILLIIHNPSIPKCGPSYKEDIRNIDIQVREDVRTLCGIGLSNPQTASAMLIACMAISLCGDRFTDSGERAQLENILVKTQQLHGWPTKAIQQQLKVSWDS